MIQHRTHRADRNRGRRRRRRRPLRRAVGMVKLLPSLLTLGNLLCGFAAVFYASRDFESGDRATYVLGFWTPFSFAAALIFLGMILDALDGRIARLTRQTSELGEQLDSMADMVTFGVAPAFLLVELIDIGAPFFGSAKADTFFDRAVLVIAAVFVACCALRLARFNIEADHGEHADHHTFKGLPSPAAAGAVASLVLLHQSLLADHPFVAKWTAVGLLPIALLAAAAMVSTLPYTHVLNRYLRGRAPFHYLTAIVIALPLLLLLPELTLAAAFGLYALSTPAAIVLRKLRRKPTPAAPAPAAEKKGTGAASS